MLKRTNEEGRQSLWGFPRPEITWYECWFKKKPIVSNLRVFGCICFVHTPDSLRKKLDPKASKAIFVRYPNETKGYQVYDLCSKHFIRNKNILFFENKFHNFELNEERNKRELVYHKTNEINDPTEIPVVEDQPIVQSQPVEPIVVQNDELVGEKYEETFMRQVDNLGPKRQHRAPNRFHPDSCNFIESLTNDKIEPKTVKEALQSEHSAEWRSAMSVEFESLTKNNTWELVPPPEGKNIVGSKWVLKMKRNSDGSLDCFKARLVAQGYTQTHGIDYEEVFAPVAKYSTIRSLLTLANAHDLEVHQLDVKTAFLNGSVEHDIYMSQPEGFIDPNRPNYVCKLNKSIYGLKQSARCWNSTLDELLTSSGY